MVLQRGAKKARCIEVGGKVLVRNYSGDSKWMKGVVEEKTGPVSYKVRINGGVVRRHVDQMVCSELQISQRLKLVGAGSMGGVYTRHFF